MLKIGSFSKKLLILSFLLYSSLISVLSQNHPDHSTQPVRPLTVESNEATREQLAFARAEGDAVDKCTAWLVSVGGHFAGQLNSGEYKLTYVLSSPEGWYQLNNNKLEWHKATGNVHFWLFVQDGADGRIVPDLNIKATIMDDNGNIKDSAALPFSITPLVHGYANNISLPSKGTYRISININPLPFHRHDPYNGDRFRSLTQAGIHVDTGNGLPDFILSELMEKQDELAKNSGNAYGNTLKAMFKQANDGKDSSARDYLVAVAVEYSEGYWYFNNGKLIYKLENDQSAEHNAHVEVSVRDQETQRFIPGLKVRASLFDVNNKLIDNKEEPFMWHPWLYHYGENWRIPIRGKYKVHVHFEPPTSKRYGKNFGKQFTEPVDIDFYSIGLKTGER